jgi:hypothetical protein
MAPGVIVLGKRWCTIQGTTVMARSEEENMAEASRRYVITLFDAKKR